VLQNSGDTTHAVIYGTDGSMFVDTSHELALGNTILFKPVALRSQNCVSASANDALVYARCAGTFRVEQYNA
jgi:hypothetical protein